MYVHENPGTFGTGTHTTRLRYPYDINSKTKSKLPRKQAFSYGHGNQPVYFNWINFVETDNYRFGVALYSKTNVYRGLTKNEGGTKRSGEYKDKKIIA